MIQLRSIPTYFVSGLRAHTGVEFPLPGSELPANTFTAHDASPPLSRFQLREKGLTYSLVLLPTDSPSLRLQHVTNVLAKQLSIVEVSSKNATAVNESLCKQEKVLFLRQQLAAINAELQHLEQGNTVLHGTGNSQEDEDELELLMRRVDILPAGSEVRCVGPSEARRLKRFPPQNAEHGVVRNYLE
jgi:ATP-dependent Lon protease